MYFNQIAYDNRFHAEADRSVRLFSRELDLKGIAKCNTVPHFSPNGAAKEKCKEKKFALENMVICHKKMSYYMRFLFFLNKLMNIPRNYSF